MKKLFLTIIVTGIFASVAMADGGDTTKVKKRVKLKNLTQKTGTNLNVPSIKPTTTDGGGGGGVPNTKLTVNEEGVPANDKKQKSSTTTTKKEEGPK